MSEHVDRIRETLRMVYTSGNITQERFESSEAALDAIIAENARLEKERDEWKADSFATGLDYQRVAGHAYEAREKVDALQAENERHRAGAEEQRAQLDEAKYALGLAAGGIGLSLAEHIRRDRRALVEKVVEACAQRVVELVVSRKWAASSGASEPPVLSCDEVAAYIRALDRAALLEEPT